MRSMQQQLGVLETISAFAYRYRETKKNLCRGGRSQDLPDTNFQPAIRQLKYGTEHVPSSINDRQYTYKRNTETLSCNHCCGGKATSIMYSESVFVALSIQNSMHMLHVMLSPVVCLAVKYFSTLSQKGTIFDKTSM